MRSLIEPPGILALELDEKPAGAGVQPRDLDQRRVADLAEDGGIALRGLPWLVHAAHRKVVAPVYDLCRRSPRTWLRFDPMAPKIRSKLPATGTTIFTVMSALAQKHGAVNLGPGISRLSDRSRADRPGRRAMRAGHNQYPLMPGVMRLREAIAAKVDASLRSRVRPRARNNRHHRRDAGDIHVDPGARASGRRSDRVRAGVRQLRAGGTAAGATPVTLPLTFPDTRSTGGR